MRKQKSSNWVCLRYKLSTWWHKRETRESTHTHLKKNDIIQKICVRHDEDDTTTTMTILFICEDHDVTDGVHNAQTHTQHSYKKIHLFWVVVSLFFERRMCKCFVLVLKRFITDSSCDEIFFYVFVSIFCEFQYWFAWKHKNHFSLKKKKKN